MAKAIRRCAALGVPGLMIGVGLWAVWPPASQAERHNGPAGIEIAAPIAELVVVSATNCAYSTFFARDVAPAYEQTTLAARAPLRWLNVKSPRLARLGLARPVVVTPTVLLVVEGREAARIEGYPGPENFLALVAAMLRDAQAATGDGAR